MYIQPGGIYGGTPDYNDFLATTLNKESPFIQQLHRKSRTLVGLGKVNKLFDFTNKKHVDSIVKPLEKKDLKFLEERFPIHEKKLKKDLKDFLEDIKPGGFYSKRDLALDKEFLKSREDFLRKQIKELIKGYIIRNNYRPLCTFFKDVLKKLIITAPIKT